MVRKYIIGVMICKHRGENMKDIKIVATELYYECPNWLKEDRKIEIVKVAGSCTAVEVDTLLYGLLGFNNIPLSENPIESLTALMQEMEEHLLFSSIR